MVIDSLAAIDVFKKRKLLLWAILGGSIEGIKAVFVLSDDRDDAGKLYRIEILESRFRGNISNFLWNL